MEAESVWNVGSATKQSRLNWSWGWVSKECASGSASERGRSFAFRGAAWKKRCIVHEDTRRIWTDRLKNFTYCCTIIPNINTLSTHTDAKSSQNDLVKCSEYLTSLHSMVSGKLTRRKADDTLKWWMKICEVGYAIRPACVHWLFCHAWTNWIGCCCSPDACFSMVSFRGELG